MKELLKIEKIAQRTINWVTANEKFAHPDNVKTVLMDAMREIKDEANRERFADMVSHIEEHH